MEAVLPNYKFSLIFLSSTCAVVFELEAKTVIPWKSDWIHLLSIMLAIWFITFAIEIQNWRKKNRWIFKAKSGINYPWILVSSKSMSVSGEDVCFPCHLQATPSYQSKSTFEHLMWLPPGWWSMWGVYGLSPWLPFIDVKFYTSTVKSNCSVGAHCQFQAIFKVRSKIYFKHKSK